MDRISEFFGVAVRMNYNDHSPPHFHAHYTEDEAICAGTTASTCAVSLAGLAAERHTEPTLRLLAVRNSAYLHFPHLGVQWELSTP